MNKVVYIVLLLDFDAQIIIINLKKGEMTDEKKH